MLQKYFRGVFQISVAKVLEYSSTFTFQKYFQRPKNCFKWLLEVFQKSASEKCSNKTSADQKITSEVCLPQILHSNVYQKCFRKVLLKCFQKLKNTPKDQKKCIKNASDLFWKCYLSKVLPKYKVTASNQLQLKKYAIYDKIKNETGKNIKSDQ